MRRALTLRSAASQTRLQSPGGTSTAPAASPPPAGRERERSPWGAKGDATTRGELGGPSGSRAGAGLGAEGLSSGALGRLSPHRAEGQEERLTRVVQAEGPAPGGGGGYEKQARCWQPGKAPPSPPRDRPPWGSRRRQGPAPAMRAARPPGPEAICRGAARPRLGMAPLTCAERVGASVLLRAPRGTGAAAQRKAQTTRI